jgi:hypothetical protein
MSPRLLPLDEIPHAAPRKAERAARARYPNRAAALQAAAYEVLDGEGCYSGEYPDTHGWLCSRLAAEDVAAEMTYMPGNTVHAERQFRYWHP